MAAGSITEQLSLPGLNIASRAYTPIHAQVQHDRRPCYTLFFAIFPEIKDAQRIARCAGELGGEHGLRDQMLEPERLHITLLIIARLVSSLDQGLLDACIAAAAGVHCPAFQIGFDRVQSFPASHAFVLRCNARSEPPIALLRQSLDRGLRSAGIKPSPSRTPHMTMLYDKRNVAEQKINRLDWPATRFALVVSHVGLHSHEWVGEWRLAPNENARHLPGVFD